MFPLDTRYDEETLSQQPNSTHLACCVGDSKASTLCRCLLSPQVFPCINQAGLNLNLTFFSGVLHIERHASHISALALQSLIFPSFHEGEADLRGAALLHLAKGLQLPLCVAGTYSDRVSPKPVMVPRWHAAGRWRRQWNSLFCSAAGLAP